MGQIIDDRAELRRMGWIECGPFGDFFAGPIASRALAATTNAIAPGPRSRHDKSRGLQRRWSK